MADKTKGKFNLNKCLYSNQIKIKIKYHAKRRNKIKLWLLMSTLLFLGQFMYSNDETKLANITLKIKGTGPLQILGTGFGSLPTQVNINGNKQNEVSRSYIFNQSINHVELFWNNPIINSNFFV